MKNYKHLILLTIACLTVFTLTSGKAYATARVLEYDLVVDDNHSYTVNVDTNSDIDSESWSQLTEIDYTLTYTVDEDNGDGSFDVYATQTNGTITKDSGTPDAMTNGSDTQIMNTGRGRVLHPIEAELLLPDQDANWNWGSVPGDTTGPFISTAVDVNDTWTQTFVYQPYNQSSQNVNVSCKLEEWTTLNGYNVAKIKRTWTEPMSGINTNSEPDETMSGNISVTEYWWFAYDENILVKSETTKTGSLDYAQGSEKQLDIDTTIVTTVELN